MEQQPTVMHCCFKKTVARSMPLFFVWVGIFILVRFSLVLHFFFFFLEFLHANSQLKPLQWNSIWYLSSRDKILVLCLVLLPEDLLALAYRSNNLLLDITSMWRHNVNVEAQARLPRR